MGSDDGEAQWCVQADVVRIIIIPTTMKAIQLTKFICTNNNNNDDSSNVNNSNNKSMTSSSPAAAAGRLVSTL